MIFFGRRSWVARHRCDHCFAVLAARMSPLDFCLMVTCGERVAIGVT